MVGHGAWVGYGGAWSVGWVWWGMERGLGMVGHGAWVGMVGRGAWVGYGGAWSVAWVWWGMERGMGMVGHGAWVGYGGVQRCGVRSGECPTSLTQPAMRSTHLEKP